MDSKNPQKKTVSVIIPACNEENYIKRTIDSLRAQTYANVEVVAVSNGSTDKTFEIAEKYADKALEFKEGFGPSRARNEGVKVASGDYFVFLDADSRITKRSIANIARVMDESTTSIFGTVSAFPSKRRPMAIAFFLFKNILHRTHIYKGVLALMFCDRELFEEVEGFNAQKKVGEYKDFAEKATAVGARYAFVANAHVTTSVRRFDKEGYLSTLAFWIKWALVSPFKSRKSVEKEYSAVR